MSDFLSNLVQRSLATAGALGAVRPQLLSIFEPPGANEETFSREGDACEFAATMEQPHRDFPPSASLSRTSELENAGEPPRPVAPSDPGFVVFELPGSPGAGKRGKPRVEFAEEMPARATSAPGKNEAIPSPLKQSSRSQPLPPHPHPPKKRTHSAELITTDDGPGAIEIETPRAPTQVRQRADPPGSQPGKPSGSSEADTPGSNKEMRRPSGLLRAFPVRPRVDFLAKPGAAHASARFRNADGKGVAVTGSRAPSDEAHSLTAAGARQVPVPHDPAEQSSEVRADRMIEIMKRDRDPDGPLPGPRDVLATSSQRLSPKPPAFARQPRDSPVAPSINVTIGRIEVRATPPPAVPSRISRAATPLMNLDEYLRQRAGGGRR